MHKLRAELNAISQMMRTAEDLLRDRPYESADGYVINKRVYDTLKGYGVQFTSKGRFLLRPNRRDFNCGDGVTYCEWFNDLEIMSFEEKRFDAALYTDKLREALKHLQEQHDRYMLQLINYQHSEQLYYDAVAAKKLYEERTIPGIQKEIR